ncbi:hypothetical protein GCM10027428_35370 [Haliea atlantica]
MAARSRKTYLYLIIFILVSFAGGVLTGLLSAKAGDGITAVEVDSANNVVRFYAGGKEVAILGSQGMHVFGDLSYNGVLMDGTPVHIAQGGANDTDE